MITGFVAVSNISSSVLGVFLPKFGFHLVIIIGLEIIEYI
jgi:uncharacterized membrane-anchored protein